MSTTTDKLALFKYDPSTDGAQTFNIKKALNDNWDKLDDAVKEILIALQNKAPAGYGLGTTPREITDWNDAKLNGWYWSEKGALNSPDSNMWFFGIVHNANNLDVCVQEVWHFPNVDKVYHWQRFCYPGTGNGTPWEWVDPPLYEGVEYRTTERYQGKPVYVKAISFGTLPNNGVASVSDDFRGTNIVSVCGIASDGSYFPYYSRHTASLGRIDIYANIYGGIWVTTTTDKSGETATIIVKYTKN